MEHITEALYMAAAVAVFLLAVHVAVMSGRQVDAMFDAQCTGKIQGELIWEEQRIE